MAGPRVGGGPSAQDTMRTMNQAMGQMMTFMQQKKQLDEMKREFDLSSQALETRQRQTDVWEVAKGIFARYKGGNLAAKDMGDDLTKLLVSGGFDPLFASNITHALANTPEDLEQQFYSTVNKALALPNDDPLKMKLISDFGGYTGAPDVRTGIYDRATNLGEIVDESLNALVEGDIAARAGEPEITDDEVIPEEKPTTDLTRIQEIPAELQKAAAERVPEVPVIKTPAPRALLEREEEEPRKTLRSIMAEEHPEAKDLPYVLHKKIEGSKTIYTDQMGRTALPEFSPEANERQNLELFGNSYPRTVEEFNSINNPTTRDKANLALFESINRSGVPSEKAEDITNIMNASGPREPLRDSAMLQEYVSKQRDNIRRIQTGNAPPVPQSIQRNEQANLTVAAHIVDGVDLSQLPNYIVRRAFDNAVKDATSPAARAKLSEDIDTIIAISKNPALASYYMPTVEANRIENRKLSLEEQRLIANREITMTNQYFGYLNWLTTMASTGGGTGEISDTQRIMLEYGRDRYEALQERRLESGATEEQFLAAVKQDTAAEAFSKILTSFWEITADVDIQKVGQKIPWYQIRRAARAGGYEYSARRIIDPIEQQVIPQVYGSKETTDPIDLNQFR